MGAKVARYVGRSALQIDGDGSPQARLLQIAIACFGNTQAISDEHERRFHIGDGRAPPAQQRLIAQRDGDRLAIAHQRETGCRFVQGSFDEPDRLRIGGTCARGEARPLELADHIICRGFEAFRSDVAAFLLSSARNWTCAHQAFPAAAQFISAADAAPIRNSTSPILNRMIQFNRARGGIISSRHRYSDHYPGSRGPDQAQPRGGLLAGERERVGAGLVSQVSTGRFTRVLLPSAKFTCTEDGSTNCPRFAMVTLTPW